MNYGAEVLAEILERHTHLENILLHFFESLPNPEAACAFLSTEEQKVLEDALAAARKRVKDGETFGIGDLQRVDRVEP